MGNAGVAQSVVQLIRNQQVVCSSHITSSKNKALLRKCFIFIRSEGLVCHGRTKCDVWNPSHSDGMASRDRGHPPSGGNRVTVLLLVFCTVLE